MILKAFVLGVTLLASNASTLYALAPQPDVKLENDLIWEADSTYILQRGTNTSGRPLRLDPPGVNSSMLVVIRPDGEKPPMGVAADYFDPKYAPESKQPGATVESKFVPLERFNAAHFYETGLYRLSWAFDSLSSQEILIYREESAPKIHVGLDAPLDSPEVVSEFLRGNSLALWHKELREKQLAASEGTKQFLFAHPQTMALCLDGEPGLKFNLLLTNIKSSPLWFPPLGSARNYLEVRTPLKEVVLRLPPEGTYEDKKTIVGAETRKWTVDVAKELEHHNDYGEDHAPKAIPSGQYHAAWMFEGKKVAEFSFARR